MSRRCLCLARPSGGVVSSLAVWSSSAQISRCELLQEHNTTNIVCPAPIGQEIQPPTTLVFNLFIIWLVLCPPVCLFIFCLLPAIIWVLHNFTLIAAGLCELLNKISLYKYNIKEVLSYPILFPQFHHTFLNSARTPLFGLTCHPNSSAPSKEPDSGSWLWNGSESESVQTHRTRQNLSLCWPERSWVSRPPCCQMADTTGLSCLCVWLSLRTWPNMNVRCAVGARGSPERPQSRLKVSDCGLQDIISYEMIRSINLFTIHNGTDPDYTVSSHVKATGNRTNHCSTVWLNEDSVSH